MKNIASYFGVNDRKLQRHYKHQISGYKTWIQLSHAQDYLIYPENITQYLSIDEVSLSKGELYTFVTNKNTGRRNRKSVVAIINGTETKTIQEVLERMPLVKRLIVKEVTLDMAPNMGLAVERCFPNSKKTIDRFHVVRLVMDAMQHLRVKLRWLAIEAENKAISEARLRKEKHQPEILSNGDTMKELLVRSKYLLYIHAQDWTDKQTQRARLLFEKYPILHHAYQLSTEFRNIYKNLSKEKAQNQFLEWKLKVSSLKIEEFNTVTNSLEHHLPNILNFFDNRNTNANAESFNSKIKGFRANLRGVTDIRFFLFRLQNLFA